MNLLAVKLAAEKVPFPNDVIGDDASPVQRRLQKSSWAAGELLIVHAKLLTFV